MRFLSFTVALAVTLLCSLPFSVGSSSAAWFWDVPCNLPSRFCLSHQTFSSTSSSAFSKLHFKDKFTPPHRKLRQNADVAVTASAKNANSRTRNATKYSSSTTVNSNHVLPLAGGLAYVRQLLQTAIQVEHSTIPLYLSAQYSIVQNFGDSNSNSNSNNEWASQLIHSVVVEEMLHMTMAANALNAVGGAPSIDDPDFAPDYPVVMPFVNVSAEIRPFSKETAATFQVCPSVLAFVRLCIFAFEHLSI